MTNPMLANELAKPFQRPLVRLLCNLLRWHRLLDLGEYPASLRIAFRGLKRNMKLEENRFHFRGVAAARLIRF